MEQQVQPNRLKSGLKPGRTRQYQQTALSTNEPDEEDKREASSDIEQREEIDLNDFTVQLKA